jgi:hypothetical protein
MKRHIIGDPFGGSGQHLCRGNEENDKGFEPETDHNYSRCSMRYKSTNLLERVQDYRQICIHIQSKQSTTAAWCNHSAFDMKLQRNLTWISAELRIMFIKDGKGHLNCCSVVSIATCYGLDGSGFDYRLWGSNIFPSSSGRHQGPPGLLYSG